MMTGGVVRVFVMIMQVTVDSREIKGVMLIGLKPNFSGFNFARSKLLQA